MGLMQKALETYDAMEGLAGIYEEGKEPLAPIGHIVTKAQIEITIDADGRFVEAKAAEKEQKIIIPVTEKSAGRTNNPPPHPLCEQGTFLLDKNGKGKQYIEQLSPWVHSAYSHPKAAAVLTYVQGGTLEEDLKKYGIVPKKEEDMIGWIVIGLGTSASGPVWNDKSLMTAYSEYYKSQRGNDRQICMLSGEETLLAIQHLKGIFSNYGNAKIISANDDKNYTYRGRFSEPEEAASVGYVASQKAHNALKWLISTQGTIHGGRAFVCWNPQGRSVPKITLPFLSQGDTEAELPTYKNYREDLRKKIAGYRENWSLSAQVVVAAFDAATTGRLAITYYSEMLGSDFLDRLAYWDETCCWKDAYKGVRSPLLYHIIAYAFGTQQGKDGKVEPDEKIVAPQMQRLLACRIDQAAFPLDIMQAIVTKAEQLQNYSPSHRNALLFTACAVIQKYYIDHQREAFDLALEPKRKDRSYQWGRMLAVMEKIERDTYDPDEKREPNAIRLQSVFVRRPAYAFKIVMEQLKSAYYPRLSAGMRIFYDRLIGEIMEQLSQDVIDYAKPLTETYLLGYYLQKSALYTKKDEDETEENDDEV